jgi:hypothetical protein
MARRLAEADQALNTSAGAAYVFVRNGTTWSQQAFLKASNPGKEHWFGVRIAIALPRDPGASPFPRRIACQVSKR